MSTLVAVKKTGAASPGLSDQRRLYKKEHWHSQIGNVQHTTLFLISCLSEIGALQCIASFQNGGEALWKGEKGDKANEAREAREAGGQNLRPVTSKAELVRGSRVNSATIQQTVFLLLWLQLRKAKTEYINHQLPVFLGRSL